MIKEIKGDLLTVNADINVQQVNCKGKMGSGLAKQIRSKYPFVYEEYKRLYNLRSPQYLLGSAQFAKVKNKYIVNL